jgi:hypothetical protein
VPRTGWLVAAGGAAFLVFLVARIPASVAARWLPAGIQASGWTGTIWSGRAAAIAIDNHPAGALNWSCRPWRLLRLEWSCRLQLEPPGGAASAELTARPDGSLSFSQVEGRLPLAPLAAKLAPGWSGWLELELTGIGIRDRWPATASGSLFIRGLAGPQSDTAALGDFELVLDAGSVGTGSLGGRLRDLGGPLQLRATVELDRDRSWQLSGEVAPGPGASATLFDGMAWLGAPDHAGRRSFTVEGRL